MLRAKVLMELCVTGKRFVTRRWLAWSDNCACDKSSHIASDVRGQTRFVGRRVSCNRLVLIQCIHDKSNYVH